MYSAAIKNSSSVADMPRFSSTGFFARPARFSSEKFGIFLDQVKTLVVDRFRDDPEPKLLAHLRQDFQPGLAQSLEAVRGSARFVGAAAEQPYARLLDTFGNRQTLFFAFHRARPGYQRHMLAAHDHLASGRGNPQDAVLFLRVPAH